jgi:uncharacterized membrane protein
MNLFAFLRLHLSTLVVFLAIDMVWLGWLARGFYRAQIGGLLREDVNWGAALLFYVLFIAGLLVFAVIPALERPGPGRAALAGGLFGLVAYATYDLTNLATLRGFTLRVAVVDMAWGFVLCALTSAAAWKLARVLNVV